MADAGEYQRSAEVAAEVARVRFKTDPREQADALAVVAGALAVAGQRHEAEQMALSLADPRQQAQALVAVAEGLVEAGQQGAAEVARKAARVARSIATSRTSTEDDRDVQVRALTVLVKGLARAGQHRRAARVIRSFPKNYQKYRPPQETEPAVREVVSARARAGQPWRARWTSERYDVPCLAAIAEGLVEAGQQQRAVKFARKAAEDDLSLRYGPRDEQVTALAAAARALARVGQQQRAVEVAGEAEQVAHSITCPDRYNAHVGPDGQARALVVVARALAEAGQQQRAVEVAGEAEQRARSITYLRQQAQALVAVARVLAEIGQHQRAVEVAGEVQPTGEQAEALADVVAALAQTPEPRAARRLAATVCAAGTTLVAVRSVLKADPSVAPVVLELWTPGT